MVYSQENVAQIIYPKNPDPSKMASLRTQKHPCFAGSNPSIGGPLGILRVTIYLDRHHQLGDIVSLVPIILL